MKLKPIAFALALGSVWGLNWFLLTWWMILFDGITHEVTLLGRWYRGFTVSPVGSLVALGYGLVDGFMLGLLLTLRNNPSSHSTDCHGPRQGWGQDAHLDGSDFENGGLWFPGPTNCRARSISRSPSLYS